jgi:peptidoglycan/xylan/chitin deacetylase (PgdA/CDA1 family)
MTGPLAVLCYHRVLPAESAGAWPYFLRGTAVTPACLRAQLAALARHGTFVDPRTPLDRSGAPARRPRIWLTFDDGYVDALRHARPLLDEVGAAATVFVTTGAALGELTLPADHWYATITSAQRSAAVVRWDRVTFDADLSSREGRARLAHSPERRAFLEAGSVAQDAMLASLSTALDASPTPRERLYLDRDELDILRAAGWSVGGHGSTHALLPRLSSAEMHRELSEMEAGLRRLGEVTPVGFAYPDGQGSSAARAALEERGCPFGVLLGDELARVGMDRLQLPRFIVPNEPDWVQRVLLPRLEVGSQ